MTVYTIAVALALLIALATLGSDAPGRTRNIRSLATAVIVAMLWFLAPRARVDSDRSTPLSQRPDSIHWSQRVVVGDPLVVRGTLDPDKSVALRLIGPEGTIDTLTTQGGFTLSSRTTAVGHWIWQLVIAGDTLQLGVDVRAQPALRLLLLEGRPSFETAALVRRLTAQGASVTTVTRLTGSEDRVSQGGPQPPSRMLSPANLASLDGLIIGPGGNVLVSAVERATVLGEVARGLGLLHLVDTLQPRTAWFPFELSTVGVAPAKVRPILNGLAADAPIAAAPTGLTGGAAVLETSAGGSLARLLSHGSGAVVAMRVVGTTGWSLAGEDSLVATLWSTVLGAVLRPARAEWRIGDSIHARVDERIIVERVGETRSEAALGEGTSTDLVELIAVPGDSLRRRAALWPNHPGWLSLSVDQDTLWLLASPTRLPDPDFGGPGATPALEWLAWLVLLAGIVTLWHRR